ncbi:DUF1467 family protein [Halocynthiibacter styelae]|uniref:DUF1467 family protein n=1 Tax=Halocynthiibacter styelae TaxID=2761955 RepID=A0A8J7IE31_9RHOB|nr:DUF1467 family protein [Paenihalocynthiibacter styelae]MBI1493092.1 DUF1467 family protein [Paenihalocynthiibacter styelae]
MAITSAIVLFAVVWFMTFLCVLPVRLKTQGEDGKVLRGTHAGAPVDPQLKKRALITTGIAGVIWAILFWIIVWEIVTVRDFDFQNRMNPEPEVLQDY